MMSKVVLVSIACLLYTVASQQSPSSNQCVTLGNNYFSACQTDLVAIEQQYSLGYSLPANKTQIAAIINAAKARGAPPPQCCQAASAFNKARCQCDSSLPQVLGNNFNYLITPKGLQSANDIAAIRCNYVAFNCTNSPAQE